MTANAAPAAAAYKAFRDSMDECGLDFMDLADESAEEYIRLRDAADAEAMGEWAAIVKAVEMA